MMLGYLPDHWFRLWMMLGCHPTYQITGFMDDVGLSPNLPDSGLIPPELGARGQINNSPKIGCEGAD